VSNCNKDICAKLVFIFVVCVFEVVCKVEICVAWVLIIVCNEDTYAVRLSVLSVCVFKFVCNVILSVLIKNYWL
jgi:hypothetical protein